MLYFLNVRIKILYIDTTRYIANTRRVSKIILGGEGKLIITHCDTSTHQQGVYIIHRRIPAISLQSLVLIPDNETIA